MSIMLKFTEKKKYGFCGRLVLLILFVFCFSAGCSVSKRDSEEVNLSQVKDALSVFVFDKFVPVNEDGVPDGEIARWILDSAPDEYYLENKRLMKEWKYYKKNFKFKDEEWICDFLDSVYGTYFKPDL